MRAWLNGLAAEFFLRLSKRVERKAREIEDDAYRVYEQSKALQDRSQYFDGVMSKGVMRRRAAMRRERLRTRRVGARAVLS